MIVLIFQSLKVYLMLNVDCPKVGCNGNLTENRPRTCQQTYKKVPWTVWTVQLYRAGNHADPRGCVVPLPTTIIKALAIANSKSSTFILNALCRSLFFHFSARRACGLHFSFSRLDMDTSDCCFCCCCCVCLGMLNAPTYTHPLIPFQPRLLVEYHA